MAYNLILDQAGVSGYVGKAEKCTYEFSTIPEQIPGEQWLADQIIQKHIDELAKENSKLLHLRVWRDTSPTWQTDYRVEVTASASPLYWNLIIIGVLAILALVITWKITGVVKNIDWGKAAAPIKWTAITVAVAVIGLILLARRK